ncbi:MAG: ThuA domain-containing protein [Planctomycetota bacterium]
MPQLRGLVVPFRLLAATALLALAAAPRAQQQQAPRRLSVLFFGAPTENGPHHDPITRYRVLKKGLGVEGIDLIYSEDPAEAFAPGMLAQFDAVLMYGNWNQHEAMKREQLLALLGYVERGGGFVPVHCASACFGGSPLFVKLVGGRFASHGGEEFEVRNVQPDNVILRGLAGFKAWDETYVHDQHGDDREVLQVRDDEPWTWTRRHGEGRVFYTASGHDHRVWDLPQFQMLLRNGIYWAVGDDKKALLDALQLPVLETEPVSLPGYRERKEITIAQKPLSPTESMKLAQVPPGMQLSLFASEPDIVNPIHVAWDERGRAFVIETIDYPNNLQRGDLGHDRITICEDTDGDGRADRFTRFAEQLSIPTSLCFANGGVICTNGSDMLFLKDTDGDDRADVREVLFTGFHMGDTHACVSNLRYGFDGWIWATIGYSGFGGEVGGERHEFGQAVFRFRPDGSKLEVLQNTTNNTWGLGFTEQFDVVGSTANGNPSFYLTFPAATYAAHGLDQPRTPAGDDNPLFFPMSMDIRQVDQFDRYTAAAGHALYTARRLPAEFHNRTAFVCEPTGKLVGNFVMHRVGAGWRAVQSPNNLYDSADAWSAPVCCEVGPDGAVWICDWYNIIVQHNPTPSRASAGVDAKTGRGNAYETPLRDTQHGRIYRVVPRDDAEPPVPVLDVAEPATLLANLDADNLLWRLHAQRLIVEGKVVSLREPLEKMVLASSAGSPHALQALHQLGLLAPRLLKAALSNGTEATRRAAITMATPADLKAVYVQNGTIVGDGRELAEVLVAFAGAAHDPKIGAAVFAVAQTHGDALLEERAMRDAWTMAAQAHAASVLAAANAAGVTIGAAKEQQNLLPNADFEQVREDGRPVGWTELRHYGGARPDAVTFRSSTEGRGGSRCLEIDCDRFTDSGVAAVLRLEAGAHYRLSGWVRTEDAQAAGRAPGMMLNVHGGPHTRGLTGTNDWTELSMEFEAPRGEAVVHCLFGGYGGAKGKAFYDDLSLVKVSSGRTIAGALEAIAQRVTTPVAGAPAATRKFVVDPVVHERGAAVYAATCIACHGIDGKGVPMAFPPLDGSDWLTGDHELPTKIVIHGLMGPVKVGDAQFVSVMTPLGPQLNDQQIADVLTYVRQRWSNDAAPVTAEQVKKVRDATKDRTQFWTAAELGR